MKAVKLYKAGDLRVEDVPIPEPLNNEVLVRVKAVGVCGSDIPRILYIGAHKERITVGHEFAGEIVSVGKDIKDWRVGDRVVVPPLIPCYQCNSCLRGEYSLCSDYDYFGSRRDGAMAEYVTVPEANLLRLPENVSYEVGAMTDPAANAWHALWRSKLEPGEDMVVFGVGPIGMFALQAAKLEGARNVIAVDIVAGKLQTAKQLGVDHVINTAKTSVVETTMEILGKEPEVAIDFTGVPSVQAEAIATVGRHGRVVFLGISHKGLNLLEEQVDKILRYELTITGSWNSFSQPFPGREWIKSIELFAAGKLIAEPIITHRFCLDEAPEVFRRIKEGSIEHNKIMFLP
ncbi:galactitol-1-phosphate 5-dehydrogenase [Moorella sp. Hama-1]|uniref:galactitol-1-phosphate 5-dehydrogenase n=1 Tax=Moorella sp. Hama-1 TaxID=2138101 RepID=UPI000D6549DB|nr:galactitol-1-phosphate 5-dehydrogenase [Moorella sp. Hama-1]BCV22700.1 galactitol-1-phosphate 5-dehydrogenase [Moorella sp. Hama-1]